MASLAGKHIDNLVRSQIAKYLHCKFYSIGIPGYLVQVYYSMVIGPIPIRYNIPGIYLYKSTYKSSKYLHYR